MAVAIASRKNLSGKSIFSVIGIDLPNKEGQKRIDSINKGNFPFRTADTDLALELSNAVKINKNLHATSSYESYKDADVILVSINCDLIKTENSDSIDIDRFRQSIETIANNMSEGALIIIESTVPPGTTQKIAFPVFKRVAKERKINKFYLAHSYERVMPGEHYLDSILNYWRVYSGVNTESAEKCKFFLEAVINTKDYPLTRVKNTIASETSKILENSYRAVNIAFIEEWSRFAEAAGFDIYEVIDAIRMRPTHSNIRQPGFGVGGYCLTKDPLFGKIAAKDILGLADHDFFFSSEAIKINNKMPLVTLKKIKKYFNNDLHGKRLLLMGVTYREGVEDTRFSPSEIFVNACESEGISFTGHDPLVSYWEELEREINQDLPVTDNYDVIVFAVPHREFKQINISKWINNNDVLIFDANNVLTESQIADINNNKLNYVSIGRS